MTRNSRLTDQTSAPYRRLSVASKSVCKHGKMSLILVPFPRTTAEKTWTEQVTTCPLSAASRSDRPPSTEMKPRTLETNLTRKFELKLMGI